MKRKRKIRCYLVKLGKENHIDVPPDILDRYGLSDGSEIEIMVS